MEFPTGYTKKKSCRKGMPFGSQKRVANFAMHHSMTPVSTSSLFLPSMQHISSTRASIMCDIQRSVTMFCTLFTSWPFDMVLNSRDAWIRQLSCGLWTSRVQRSIRSGYYLRLKLQSRESFAFLINSQLPMWFQLISLICTLPESEYYFTTVTWINEEVVMVTWVTREQNYASISTCQAGNSSSEWLCTTVSHSLLHVSHPSQNWSLDWTCCFRWWMGRYIREPSLQFWEMFCSFTSKNFWFRRSFQTHRYDFNWCKCFTLFLQK